MNIEWLRAHGFTVYGQTEAEFPKRGVVLVTGPNGSGKSSLIEMVSYGGWGSTLRGTTPGGGADAECSVQVQADGLAIKRARRLAKTALEWTKVSEAQNSEQFPTASKAQNALEELIGPWEVWRRTHVFSSTDAAHFTQATDKERKLFLETLLGLGRFDEALEKCRKALRGAMAQFDDAKQAKLVALARKEEIAHRLQAALSSVKQLGPAPDPEDVEKAPLLEAKRAKLREHLKGTDKELGALHRRIAELSADTGGSARELQMIARQLTKMEEGVCDACGQPIPKDKQKELQVKFDALRKAIDDQKTASREATRDLDAEVMDVMATQRKLQATDAGLIKEISRLAEKARDAHHAEQVRASASRTLTEAEEAVAGNEAAIAAARDAFEKANREVNVLEAVEVALGLKGARAAILSRLLGSLENAANAWLPRLAGKGMKLELRPYSEKKSGGVSDAISLQVVGAGGGEGYRAASGGERRRLDVAILLAFAGKGTLFFDEVFDALDNETGVQAVIEVLEELSKDRCVVVVTHNEELSARLPHVLHWRVRDGAIS